MQARHALQAAALQFGRDGTDRSLSELAEAYRAYQAVPPDPCMHLSTSMWANGKATCFECGAGLRESYQAFLDATNADPVNEAIPATLTDESHAEASP